MKHLHHYWNDLTAMALVGTARSASLPQPAPAALEPLIAGLAGVAEPAERLLSVSAAASLALRAGALPAATAFEELPPAPADERPPCGPRAARHLAALLAGGQRALLPEWLGGLAASGRRPPDELLPALLDAARGELWLRPLAVPAAGARGRWLAELNPAWSFAVDAQQRDPAALAELWQTGARNGRLFLLQALRADEPALARSLVESTWASERAEDRAAFVGALATGLSAADEPFLEGALDDRGKEVRARAAELLACLPDSRLARRMAERALALIRRSGGFLPRLEVRLPEACDKSLQRDGIDPKPPPGSGERAWWLRAIVARTPPSTWSAAWGLTPAQILATGAPREWRALLLEAWSTAAVSYRDPAWAEALFALAPREPVPTATLLPVVPAERREPLLARLLADRRPFGREHPALDALRAAPGPWSEALARAVIAAIARRTARIDDVTLTDWHLQAALEQFALAIPPALAEEAAAALPADLYTSAFWSVSAQGFAERLRLRRDMLAALRAGD